MSLVHVSNISRKEEGAYLVKNVSFVQQPFQNIAIVGATGSGKTTLLKLIAGLVQASTGSVHFEGLRVEGPEEKLMPGHPGIAYLSQHFELRNHYRVEELLAMANQLSEEEAARIYEICRIDHLLKRWSHQLSGGEKQRIALARLLVTAPRLLLLDEPYSNLDVFHKNLLKSVIRDISERLQITCLLVSHDPTDILSWADEILVLNQGEIIQQDTPEHVYRKPVNEYVAALFGKYNVLPQKLIEAFSELPAIEVSQVQSFSRPGDFILVADARKGIKAEVEKVNFLGSHYEVEVLTAGHSITLTTIHHHLEKGDTVFVSLSAAFSEYPTPAQ